MGSYYNRYQPRKKGYQSRNNEPMIDLNEAWALVAMADRINKQKYIKQDSDDEKSNRTLISASLKHGKPAVTKKDRELGAKLSEHFQYLVLNSIMGKVNEFDNKILSLIQQEEIGERSGFAFLACLPARYHRELKREALREEEEVIGLSSKHQGEVNEKIERTVRLLSKFEGKTFGGSVVKATDGENLYFWTSSRLISDWPDVGIDFKVKARVKAHNWTRDTGRPETRLTRVQPLA